jgi:hypothetical protein
MPQLEKDGFNYYITSQVGYCGRDVTQKCASDIMAGFDEEISSIAAAITEMVKKPK